MVTTPARPRSPSADGGAAWLRDYDRVAEAIVWLDAHRLEQPRLADVARALSLSPHHLQRTFTRFAGVSPNRLLRWLTADAATRLLRDRATVLDTATALGLSSTGRLHDLTVTLRGVTPGEVSRGGGGLTLRTAVHPTRFGRAFVAVSERGVVALRFLDTDPGAEADVRADFAAGWPDAVVVEDPAATAYVIEYLTAVLDGGAGDDGGGLPVLAVGTNLQLQVWEALLRVPDDAVVTYGALAEAVGHPRAVRAVASAVGRNPVAVLIPCHRVLRATGGIGGYRWGEVRKRAILAREAARAGEVPDEASPATAGGRG